VVRFSLGVVLFSLHHRFYTGSRTHPANYSVGFGDKMGEVWS